MSLSATPRKDPRRRHRWRSLSKRVGRILEAGQRLSPEPPREPGQRGNVLLRNASFRRYWLARCASHLGDGASLLALLLYVKQIEHSGIAVAVFLLAQSLPRLLGPVLGAAVDRLDLKWLMVCCEAVQAVIFAGMALWLPGFPALIVLVVVASILDTAFSPASSSAIQTLVEEADLMQANAWGESAPVLLVGIPRIRRDVTATTQGIRAATLEGLVFAWHSQAVRAVVLGAFLLVSFTAVDNVALVFLTRDALHTSTLGFGIVSALFGVGMLVASMGLSWLRTGVHPAVLVWLGWLLSGVGTLATGLAPNLITVGGTQAIAGVGNGIDNAATSTLIQRLVPPAMLGRVFGLFGMATFTGSTIAYVLAGLLLDATTPRATFIVGGAGAIASALLVGPLLWLAVKGRFRSTTSN